MCCSLLVLCDNVASNLLHINWFCFLHVPSLTFSLSLHCFSTAVVLSLLFFFFSLFWLFYYQSVEHVCMVHRSCQTKYIITIDLSVHSNVTMLISASAIGSTGMHCQLQPRTCNYFSLEAAPALREGNPNP